MRERIGGLEQLARYVVQYKLTSAGRSLIVLGLIAGMTGYTLELPIFYAFCALFALGFIALVVNAIVRPRLNITGSFPQLACAGQPVTGWISIANTGRRPAFEVDATLFPRDRALRVTRSNGALDHLAVELCEVVERSVLLPSFGFRW